jgi:CheY-like chemotaxis protein/anti-sigma regulatory factor (Ser/Thr protein kinase)
MEPVHIRIIIRDVVDSMTPTAAARGIHLRLSAVPPVQVTGDIRRLEQVFFNLIDNALKFTPKDGHVTIDARIVDDAVAVRVQDNGAGIDPAFLPYVFDRFRQADATTTRNHGGLGLGLSIAKQLVEAHNGTISVESPGLGCGTSFTVVLPITAEVIDGLNSAASHGSTLARGLDLEKPPAPPMSDLHPPRLDGLRVLVVDDERDSRDIMAHTLEAYGAHVVLASNVHDAIDILEHATVDALLADISMPEEDGFALIRRVRASKFGRVAVLPAAAVTSLSQDEQRDEVLAAGFHLHLTKPFDPDQLAYAVEKLTRGAVH